MQAENLLMQGQKLQAMQAIYNRNHTTPFIVSKFLSPIPEVIYLRVAKLICWRNAIVNIFWKYEYKSDMYIIIYQQMVMLIITCKLYHKQRHTRLDN